MIPWSEAVAQSTRVERLPRVSSSPFSVGSYNRLRELVVQLYGFGAGMPKEMHTPRGTVPLRYPEAPWMAPLMKEPLIPRRRPLELYGPTPGLEHRRQRAPLVTAPRVSDGS